MLDVVADFPSSLSYRDANRELKLRAGCGPSSLIDDRSSNAGVTLTNSHKDLFLGKNYSTQDSRVVPHRGTNWAALWLTAQIRRDAVLSESYGRR